MSFNWSDTVLIGLAGGTVLPHIQKLGTFIADRAINNFFIRLTVNETSECFYWIQHYMLAERSTKVNNLYYRTFFDSWLSGDLKGEEKNDIFYNYGYQFIKFKGNTIFLMKSNEAVPNTTNPYKNKIQSFVLYSKKRSTLVEFTSYIENTYGKRHIKYYFNKDGNPCLGGKVINKTFDNTFLPEETTAMLKADLDRFAKSKEIYNDLGIRYKRTYLFHGPPGTGKSSLSLAISNYTRRDILSINISKDLTDSALISLISARPDNSIVLFEDLDCLLPNLDRNDSADNKEDKKESVTLSCLLNILDGIYTPSDVIFVITTNNLDKIDPAIKRSGRADIILQINPPTKEMLDDLKMKYQIQGNVDSISDLHLKIVNESLS
jgi:ATP-dependent Zn protease